jgi:RNA 2',3'-cyclic 3'-phosphodiesterase
MKRIFIAVDISDKARQKVASYIENLRRSFPQLRVGWERPEKLHLTLKFLGDVNDGRLEEVQKAIGKIVDSNPAFQMTLGRTGRFPPKGDPKILWLGTIDKGEFAAVASKINDDLEQLGFEREKRRFSPHLTIARLREPRLSGELAAKHLENDFGPIRFEVGKIVVYESKLLPKGSVYTQVTAFPLKTSRSVPS